MGNWQAKIYLNDEIKTVIKVKNDTSLREIRILCESFLSNNLNYYFLTSKDNVIIINDNNFSASDVWKNDEVEGYRIDLVTSEFYELNKNGCINLYLNDFKNSAILYRKNMSLKDVKLLGGPNINRDSVYFLTKDNVIIENYSDFKAKDVVKIGDDGKRIINLVDREYYKRIQVIEHLKKLQSSKEKIDWLAQTEFFKKIKDFAGEEIANAIINELLDRYGKNEKINDRDYIQKFLNLLIPKNSTKVDTNRTGF